MVRYLLAALLALLTLGLCGCGGPPAPAAGPFVGAVPGRSAYLAVLTGGERVAGYLCGGADLGRWMRGERLDGGAAALVGPRRESSSRSRHSYERRRPLRGPAPA